MGRGMCVSNAIHAFPFLSKYVNATKMMDIAFPPLEKLVVAGYDFEEAPDNELGWYKKTRVDWLTRFKWLKYQSSLHSISIRWA